MADEAVAVPQMDDSQRMALVKIDADSVMMALGMPHETKLVQIMQLKGDDPSVITLLVQSPDLPIVPKGEVPPFADPFFTQTFEWNIRSKPDVQAN